MRVLKLRQHLVMVSVCLVVSLGGPSVAVADDETAREQAAAVSSEQGQVIPPPLTTLPRGRGAAQVTHPLFMGVDDVTVPAYQVDPATANAIQAFVGYEVWGAAYDEANDRVFFNSGSTLYVWPVGGAVSLIGTIVDGAGATQSMVSLAFYGGTLYGTKNIANEAVWIIDPGTLVATVHIDYVDADFDFGGLAADPTTGELYGTNDDTTPFGSGLFRINLNGTATKIADYPVGETDIDGLAISDSRVAYLVTDEPGVVYPYDLVAGAYLTPFSNPWTSSEVFSGATWIFAEQPSTPAIEIVKTVGTNPATCAATDEITVPAGTEVYYCYTVTNTGDVTLNLHDLDDSELGNIFTGFNYALAPGASVDTVTAGVTASAVITVDTTNTATWTGYNTGPTDVASAQASAIVNVLEQVEEAIPTAGPLGLALFAGLLLGAGMLLLRRLS